MTVDIAHARDSEETSIGAAATAAAIGGTGIEVAAGGGDGVSTVMRFFPSDLTVHVGDTVTFVDRDPFTPHTVTFGIEPPGAIEGLVPPENRTCACIAPTAYAGAANLQYRRRLCLCPRRTSFSARCIAPGR